MQFHPLFHSSDPVFKALAATRKSPPCEALPISPWVAMSAMQKGVRRGNVPLALGAAAKLLNSDPGKLWRRLSGIVFEDIGLADLDCIALVLAGTSGKKVREQFGGEWAVASLLVATMCSAKKCRAADDLFIAISHHHELEPLRVDLARETLPQHLARVQSRSALLGSAISVLHASGVRWTGQVTGQASNSGALFAAIQSAGVEREIVRMSEQGFRRTWEPLPPLMALASLAGPCGKRSAIDDEFPEVVLGRNGLPTFVLDAFSYEGKSALARFLKRNTSTARWLRRYVPAKKHMQVLAGGIFRVEGGLVRQRVEWPAACTLRSMADTGYHGSKLPDPSALLDTIREDLPKLDAERGDIL